VTSFGIDELSQLVRFCVHSPNMSVKVVFPLENLAPPS
jgi:hypothetical protein